MKPIRLLAAAVLALCAVAGSAAAQVAYTDTDPATGARITRAVTPQMGLPTTGAPSTDGSTTITTGGTAQALFSSATPINGFKVAIPSASSGGAPCWVSDTTTTPSATTAGSYPVYQQGQWSTEPGEKPAGPVYLNCPTTGQVVSAKKW